MSEQDPKNPYVGLRPFFADDSLYFFGRETQTLELLEILHKQHFLGVVGSSGSGKSSLVRAGLQPALRGGFLVGDRDRWRIVQMKPGGAPIFNLAAGLQAAMGKTLDDRAALEKAIREEHTDAIVEFLKPQLDDRENVFLLVDQFEEIFSFRGADRDDGLDDPDPDRNRQRAARKAEATDFVDLVMALANQSELPIYVALTMRTDFLGDCDLFYGLPEALNRGRYLVPRLTREQLRDAIECPAMLQPPAQIAPRLADHLLNELGDRFDRLPVLQHALQRTFDAWQRAGRTGPIDLPHYQEAGGLARALDVDAELAMKGLNERVTSRVFKRLTKTDASGRRVRDPARASELIAASGADRADIDQIIRHFQEDGRSFVHASSEDDPDDPRVDISHESLIRQWVRLRTWVDEERASRDRYIEVVARAQKWERGEASLPTGLELSSYVDWSARQTLTPGWTRRYFGSADALGTARRYLAEAELQRRWERPWGRLIVFIGVVVGVLLLIESSSLVVALGAAIKDVRKAMFDLSKWFWAALNLGLLSVTVIVYMGVCIGVNRCGQWIYRKVSFPSILEDISSSEDPGSARGQAEIRDAAVANNTIYATTPRRIGAYCIDFFLQLLVVSIVFALALAKLLDETVFFTFLVAVVAFSWCYGVLQVASKRQATLGMRLFGIYRTDLGGARLSIARATVWWLARFLSSLPYGLGFFIQPFTPKGQTFHDWLAGSVVLLRPQAVASSKPAADVSRTESPAPA
jgi:uncharacterized RDD family membrane protein YckC